MLIDDDPQGSLTLWNDLREQPLPLKIVKRCIADSLRKAERDEAEWVFVDTPPNMSANVVDALQCATLVVVPCRPGIFDVNAVLETISFAREARTPYAVVINGAPPKRDEVQSACVVSVRERLAELKIPVWGGQITHRANFSLALAKGEGVKEYEAQSGSAAEIARLWLAIERSVRAINGAGHKTAMHCVAA